MMDNSCILSNKQSLVQAAGAILSTFSFDTGVIGTVPDAFQAVGNLLGLDPGRGHGLQAWAQVTTAFASATSALTCKCALVMADDAALATGLTVLSETPAIACAALLAGYQFRLGTVPPGITQRFLGFRYTTATEDATAGIIMAGILTGRGSIRVTGTSG